MENILDTPPIVWAEEHLKDFITEKEGIKTFITNFSLDENGNEQYKSTEIPHDENRLRIYFHPQDEAYPTVDILKKRHLYACINNYLNELKKYSNKLQKEAWGNIKI